LTSRAFISQRFAGSSSKARDRDFRPCSPFDRFPSPRGPNAIRDAIGYAKFYSRSHHAVIRVYDEAGNVIDTHETRCSEKAWRIDQALNKYADESLTQPKGIPMLWTIIVILVVLWLLGFIGHVGGSLIHILLVIAVIVLIINLVQGRRGL
jgi:hypothetical protein